HIKAVQEAMNVGVEFIGFCCWSFIDLISGHSGFSKRYGFVYVNRDEHDLKDMARRKKKSFYWYQKLIETNGEDLD
ncbi:MAG: family 1 glycosylhydrolase, partial [Erysipelotrichaceae bacterium]|nr:family 1 glycosylhydrolase [Erysipelotrichaceae bacterium]